MPGYEKFEHYDQNPQPAVPPAQGMAYPALPLPNNAYTDYNEAHIRDRMAGQNGLPPLQYDNPSVVGVSLKNINGGNVWHDQDVEVDNGNVLTIPCLLYTSPSPRD